MSMNETDETKTEQVNMRLTPTVKRVAENAAKAEHRTLTNLIETALWEYLQNHGHLEKEKPKGTKPLRRKTELPPNRWR
jgi:hypothetical protein